MKKIVFNGFRHGHINGLYGAVKNSPEMEIIGCYEPDAEAREKASKQLKADISGEGYAEMLKNADIVAIGGRYGESGAEIIEALKNGKHVIADKPICTSLSEFEEIKKLSTENDLSVIIMLDLRYIASTQIAKPILDSGELGEVRNVSFTGQHCLDYGRRPMWYFEEGMHGGTVNDIAIHGVDLVRYLTGLNITKADVVRTWNSYAKEEPHFKDCATFMARLENGAGVMADVSYSSPSAALPIPSYWEFRFWCEYGMLEFNYATPCVKVYKKGESEVKTVWGDADGTIWLTDLLHEINTGDRSITEDMLESSKQTLILQAEAKD